MIYRVNDLGTASPFICGLDGRSKESVETLKAYSTTDEVIAIQDSGVYIAERGRCGNRFEHSSGHTTTPCELEKDHKGNCKGTILGSTCYWSSEFETEEQMHYAQLSDQPPTEPKF